MLRALLLFVLLLGGSRPDVRDIALAEVDLGDVQAVQSIRSQLGADDARAFASFVARHHVESANFCGRPPLMRSGRLPETVGDAIDLAAQRDAMDRAALRLAQAPKHPRQLAREEWDRLIRDRDMKLDALARLQSQYGKAAVRRADWAPLQEKLADIDRQLVAMKPYLFGSGG